MNTLSALLRTTFTATLLAAAATATLAADLRVGFMPGPYRDAFTKGIAPQLEKKG